MRSDIVGAMDRFRARRDALRRAILEGEAVTAASERQAAHDGKADGPAAAYLGKVARHAYRITDDDLVAARAAGLDDAAIFELTVAAAVGQATRQIDSALAALAEATATASDGKGA